MISWREIRALFSGFVACAVVILLSFCVVTLLPADTFSITKAESGIEIATAICLFLGAFLQVLKRFITLKLKVTGKDGDWRQVFRAALVLAFLGIVIGVVIFVMNFFAHASLERKLYFGAMVLFLGGILLTPSTLAAYDPRQDDGWLKKVAYLIDRYSLALYIGVYIQIIFLESREILDMDKRNTAHGLGPVGQTPNLPGPTVASNKEGANALFEDAYDGLKTAAYAIFVELFAFLFICHAEQWRLQRKHGTLAKSDKGEECHLTLETDKFQPRALNDWKAVSRGDYMVLVIGILSLAPLVVLAIVHGAGRPIGHSLPISVEITVIQIFFFGGFSLYLLILLGYLKPCHVTDCRNVLGSLDVILLRWSTYGVFLFLTLVIAGMICGPAATRSYAWLMYVLYVLNILQIWIQYSVLLHLLSLLKHLHSDLPSLKKLRLHACPLLLANAFLWVYNLWQWKSVSYVAFSTRESTPGSLWEIVEAVLFLPAIFFRFHSAFLGFMLLHSASRWARFSGRVSDKGNDRKGAERVTAYTYDGGVADVKVPRTESLGATTVIIA